MKKRLWRHSFSPWRYISSRDSNYIVDLVLWPKFCNSSTSMERNFPKLNFIKFDLFFEGFSWFKFNNFRLKQGMALKLYTSVWKRLKLKVRNVQGLIVTFVKVKREKLTGGLNRVKSKYSAIHRMMRGYLIPHLIMSF